MSLLLMAGLLHVVKAACNGFADVIEDEYEED